MKIHGHVVDARTRRPLAGCVVTVKGFGGSTVVANEHGHFEFDGLASGWTYELQFEQAGYHPTTEAGVTGGDREFAMEPTT